MRTLTALALLLAAGTAFGDVYRWVDDKGVVHYSDKAPSKDAKPTELPPVQTFKPQAVTSGQPLGGPTTTVNSNGDQSGSSGYRPNVAQPAANDTLRDAEGRVNVVVGNPSGDQGILYVYYLDGAAKSPPTQASSFELAGVERGEHHVAVAATDTSGRELSRSAPVTFYQKPPTVKH
jgi:hypothetical protein